tara:strand:- start:762 stop:1544 length:783 start_codon:yes stop_codon:yes gene_type:complete
MLLNYLVVGSCINSALYAYVNDFYYLPNLNMPPLFYEKIKYKFLLSEKKDFTWSRLMLTMALQGKLLSYQDLKSIKFGENTLKVILESSSIKYQFKNCYIFDTSNLVLENEVIVPNESKYIVYDDFELSNLGAKHKWIDPKISQDVLSKEIHYYISDRVDGADYVTDCVVKSELTKEQLNSFDYSDTMCRFAVERHLQEIKIYGSFMNFYKNGLPKFRKPKVVHRKRLVIEKDMNSYKDSKHIKFLNLSAMEILNDRIST